MAADDTSPMSESRNGASRSGPTKRSYVNSVISYLRSNITVEPVLFLYSFGVFMNAPTLQNLMFTRTCLETGAPIDFCLHNITAREDENVQRWTSHLMMYTTIAFLTPASIMAMYTGSWSDRMGRKLPLIIPPIGFIITAMAYAAVNMYIESSPLWAIPFIAVINGLCGGEITMIAASVSYVISVSDVENRIQRLAVVEGMIAMGATLGPLASGFLTTHSGHTPVFFTVAGLVFLSLLYAVFCIKEIKPGTGRAPPSRHLFSLMHIKEAVAICFKSRPRTDRRCYIVLSLIASSLAIVPMGLEFGINYLYLKDKPLYWDYSTYTLLTALTAGLRGIGLLFILPIIRKYCCKISDPITGIIGGVSATVYLLVFGLATNTTTIFMTSILGCLHLYLMVASRSIISKNVDKTEEGKVFSFLSMLHNVLFIISGSIYNSLWPLTRTIYKGLLHECSCVNMVICIAIMAYLQYNCNIKTGKVPDKARQDNCDGNENESNHLTFVNDESEKIECDQICIKTL